MFTTILWKVKSTSSSGRRGDTGLSIGPSRAPLRSLFGYSFSIILSRLSTRQVSDESVPPSKPLFLVSQTQGPGEASVRLVSGARLISESPDLSFSQTLSANGKRKKQHDKYHKSWEAIPESMSPGQGDPTYAAIDKAADEAWDVSI